MAEAATSFLKHQDADLIVEHLTNVFAKLIPTAPGADAASQFEAVSLALKNGEAEADGGAPESEAIAAQANLHLIKPPKKVNLNEDGEEEEEEEEEDKEQAAIPDIQAEGTLLQWAGMGIPAQDLFLWNLSIQKLATDNELTNVRFWGAVTGTKRDYYVVEAKLEEYPEEEGAEEGGETRNEPMGQGANECIYYVANSPSGGWTKLPAVEADHIVLARKMKRFFTGDLDATVFGFPRFPATEKHYLRAQIARINAGAYAVPKGVFSVDPEDEEQTVAENEEYGGIQPMLMDGNAWVHGVTHLLKEGRTTPFVSADAEEDEEDEEDAEAAAKKKEEEAKKEVPPPKLREVSKDKGGGWGFSVYPSPENPEALAVARCGRWPGAVSIAQGKKYMNFYFGNGQKKSKFSVPTPAPMATEFDDGELEEEADIQAPEGWTPAEEEEEDPFADENPGKEGEEGEGEE